MNKSRILVAVSSPWASQKLAAPIADLAKRLDAEVVITHVAQLHDEDEHEADAHQRGEQTLQLLTEQLQQTGITCKGLMLISDDISKAILKSAKKEGCTLVVLGLTGKGVLKRLIAGDVPANIIRQADLPVLLCPANWTGMI